VTEQEFVLRGRTQTWAWARAPTPGGWVPGGEEPGGEEPGGEAVLRVPLLVFGEAGGGRRPVSVGDRLAVVGRPPHGAVAFESAAALGLQRERGGGSVTTTLRISTTRVFMMDSRHITGVNGFTCIQMSFIHMKPSQLHVDRIKHVHGLLAGDL